MDSLKVIQMLAATESNDSAELSKATSTLVVHHFICASRLLDQGTYRSAVFSRSRGSDSRMLWIHNQCLQAHPSIRSDIGFRLDVIVVNLVVHMSQLAFHIRSSN